MSSSEPKRSRNPANASWRHPSSVSQTSREVLVIEDDVYMQEMVASVLAPLGYQTQSATDGVVGLALLRAGRERFCLVLLDLGLTGMNGLELLAEQAHDPTIDYIPVIVMSGRHEIEERFRSKAWVHTLHKPLALQELIEAVTRFAR
jgi:CheY-like chemotaxis protein